MAAPTLSALRLAKNNLRKKMKESLLAMSKDEKSIQSSSLCRKFLASEEYKKSRRVGIYLSMSDEIDTAEIMTDIFKTNRLCFIPRYVGPKMDMLRLHSMQDFEGLPLTKWKIKQPADDDSTREEALSTGGFDLLLVPGLAFTEEGRRLGRGKGYYDSYLAQMKKANMLPTTIGLAFSFQLCEDVPTNEDDFIIDRVIHNCS